MKKWDWNYEHFIHSAVFWWEAHQHTDNGTKWHTTVSGIQRIVWVSVELHNVMDKNHSDDQINTFRLVSSNDKLLLMLTMASSFLCKAAVCKAVTA